MCRGLGHRHATLTGKGHERAQKREGTGYRGSVSHSNTGSGGAQVYATQGLSDTPGEQVGIATGNLRGRFCQHTWTRTHTGYGVHAALNHRALGTGGWASVPNKYDVNTAVWVLQPRKEQGRQRWDAPAAGTAKGGTRGRCKYTHTHVRSPLPGTAGGTHRPLHRGDIHSNPQGTSSGAARSRRAGWDTGSQQGDGQPRRRDTKLAEEMRAHAGRPRAGSPARSLSRTRAQGKGTASTWNTNTLTQTDGSWGRR